MLPRSTKDRLHFLDTLKKNHTEFFSTSVMKINNQTYSFEYRPIISAVKEILKNKEIATNCVFDYQEIYISIEVSKFVKKNLYIDIIAANNMHYYLKCNYYMHLT